MSEQIYFPEIRNTAPAHFGAFYSINQLGMKIVPVVVMVFCVALMSANAHAASEEVLKFEEYELVLNDTQTPLNERIEGLRSNPPKALDSVNKKAYYHMAISQLLTKSTLPKQAVEEVNKGLQLIDRQTSPNLYYLLKITQANALVLLQQGASVLTDVEAAIKWAEQQGNNELVAQGSLTVANIHLRSKRFSLARANALKSFEISKQIDSTALSSQTAEVIANIYARQGNYELASQFYIESANFAEAASDPIGLSFSLFGLGRMYLFLERYDEAEASFIKSKNYAEQAGDKLGIAYAFDFLAQVYVKKNDYNKAEEYRLASIDIYSEMNAVFSERQALLDMVVIAIEQNDIEKALIYYEKGQAHPFQRTGESFALRESEAYAKLLALQGNYQEAFELLATTFEKKDMRYQNARREMQKELALQLESEAKINENKLLESINDAESKYLRTQKKQQIQLWILYICVVSVSVAFIAWVFSAKKKKSWLLELANTDSLSALSNRRSALSLINHQIALAHSHETVFSAAIIDIDHFKKINDTYGHEAGDAVLRGFGQLCKKTFRQTDIIGRIGGEEFVVGFPHTPCIVAEEALRSLGKAFKTLGASIGYPDLSLTMSVGIAQLVDQIDAEALISDCDKALYEAKNEGRDQIKIFMN